MMIHRTTMGAWQECARGDDCTLLIHIPDITVEEVSKLPQSFLFTLIEAVDPPNGKLSNGTKMWLMEKSTGFGYRSPHRDHDLPAVIHPDGTLEYWWGGKKSRQQGLTPAVIYPDGSTEYWYRGMRGEQNGENSFVFRA